MYVGCSAQVSKGGNYYILTLISAKKYGQVRPVLSDDPEFTSFTSAYLGFWLHQPYFVRTLPVPYSA